MLMIVWIYTKNVHLIFVDFNSKVDLHNNVCRKWVNRKDTSLDLGQACKMTGLNYFAGRNISKAPSWPSQNFKFWYSLKLILINQFEIRHFSFSFHCFRLGEASRWTWHRFMIRYTLSPRLAHLNHLIKMLNHNLVSVFNCSVEVFYKAFYNLRI